jgi:hypothetical protein
MTDRPLTDREAYAALWICSVVLAGVAGWILHAAVMHA